MMGAIFCALALGACAEWHRISTLNQYRHQVLRVKDNGPGAERLAMEADHDPVVGNFVRQNGQPDYIWVEDVDSLKLIYTQEDRVVDFHKQGFWDVTKTATIIEPIPDEISALFTRTDRESLAEVRHGGRNTPGISPTPDTPVSPATPLPTAVRMKSHTPRSASAPTTTPTPSPRATATPTTPRPTKTSAARPTAHSKSEASKKPGCVDTSNWNDALKIVSRSWSLGDYLPLAEWTLRVKNSSCTTTFSDIIFSTEYSASSGTVVAGNAMAHTEYVAIKPDQTVTVKFSEYAHSQAKRASVWIAAVIQ